MRRLLIAALFLALTAPAMAQGPAEEATLPECATSAVSAYLALTPDQVATWEVLIAEREFAAAPIRDQLRAVQQAIEDQFASGNPDPETLGLLMIDRRDLGEQLGDIHRIYVEGFEMMLDEDQAERLRLIRAADRVDWAIPAFKVMGLTPFHPHLIGP
jgi:hypothetical protein